MTNTHLKSAIKRSVSPSQREPLREDQVENSAGGFVWAVDKWTHLRRFLILGSSGGTYYISERDLTKEGLDTIKACLAEDGRRTVNEIVKTSHEGRAPKNDYAIFALAVVVALGDDAAKSYALNQLSSVCRIGTHLFQFADYLDSFGCLTGRAKRRALAGWYANKSPDKLAYDVIKYRQRDGWSHRDILRLAHPARNVSSGNPTVDLSEEHRVIFNWIAKSDDAFVADATQLQIIAGFERIQGAKTPEYAANLITEFGLPREAVPTEFLREPVVWQALLDAGMPMTAMIRNLGNMTKIGLLTSQSEATQSVINALKNEDAIRRSRIHPMNVLMALKTYASGGGWLGRGSWQPVAKVINALDSAFYASFGNVEPTGKRIMLALDISSSMGQPVGGYVNRGSVGLTCYEAEAAMALVTEAVEDRVEIMGFNTNFESLAISSRQREDDVVTYISRRGFGGTDCALPMLYAKRKGLEIDAFVIYTDNETWAGQVHPAQALAQYRKSVVSDARLVTVAFCSNRYSIADPSDPGMLDVVGFDSSSPNIISEFVAGRI